MDFAGLPKGKKGGLNPQDPADSAPGLSFSTYIGVGVAVGVYPLPRNALCERELWPVFVLLLLLLLLQAFRVCYCMESKLTEQKLGDGFILRFLFLYLMSEHNSMTRDGTGNEV